MRKIRFRAWDSLSKSLFNVDVLEWNKGRKIDGSDKELVYIRGNRPQLVEIQSGAEDDLLERFSLMQFTGVKDRHGVEICEGDVVIYEEETRVVVWAGTCWELQLPDTAAHAWDAWRPDLTIVVGNIYQNEDLVKQKLEI